jgi:hypothetical protein
MQDRELDRVYLCEVGRESDKLAVIVLDFHVIYAMLAEGVIFMQIFREMVEFVKA